MRGLTFLPLPMEGIVLRTLVAFMWLSTSRRAKGDVTLKKDILGCFSLSKKVRPSERTTRESSCKATIRHIIIARTFLFFV